MVWQFEQIRAALHIVWPWVRPDLDRPVLVLAARDEASLKSLAPQYWEDKKGGVRPASVFVTGLDRYYVLLRTDVNPQGTDGINPYQSAYWSYAGIVLETGFTKNMPLWFFRGLADVMSNTIVRDTSIQLGRPIPWYLQRLQSGGRLLVRDLIKVDSNSQWASTESRLPTLDAQCWALMHFLMFGDQAVHRTQLDQFVRGLDEGKSPTAAFESAFGGVDAIERALVTYVSRPIWQYERIDVDLEVKREAFATRVLTPAEFTATRAAVFATMRRLADGHAAIADARKLDAAVPSSYDAEGLLADVEGQRDAALAAYGKAIDLGSTHYWTYYRWAALTRRPQQDAEVSTRLDRALERATSLNSNFAPAYSLLADTRTEAGHADDALGVAKRAIALQPGATGHRLALARALWRLRKVDEATQEARNGLALAQTDVDRQAAQQLLDFLIKNATPPARRSD